MALGIRVNSGPTLYLKGHGLKETIDKTRSKIALSENVEDVEIFAT